MQSDKPKGRPPRVDRPAMLHVSIPESLKTRVELLLFSEVEARVPQGAWQKFIVPLIESRLKELEQPNG